MYAATRHSLCHFSEDCLLKGGGRVFALHKSDLGELFSALLTEPFSRYI